MRYSLLDLVSWLVNFFVGVAEALLGLRVLLRLFAANPDASFVNWIYNMSDTLLAPFRGIFPLATLKPGYVLDTSALFAMAVYAIAGYMILSLIAMLPVRERIVESRPSRLRGRR